MTQSPSIKKSVRKRAQAASAKPPDIAAQARLFAEVAADCSRGILPGDYSEAGISAFAAETAELFWEMRIAKADRWSQIEQPPAVAERKLHRPSIKTMVEQAEKAGKPLASLTLPDGTELDFGKAERHGNEVDEWIAKHADKTQRH